MSERRDLLASLLPAAKALRRIEDEAAATCAVTMWQYAILWTVAEQPGLNQAQVADRMDYSRNRIIADLDTLSERGLLVRTPGADRRSNVLRVTDEGRTVMRTVKAEIHRREDELLADLTAQERREVDRVVQRLGRAAVARARRDRRG